MTKSNPSYCYRPFLLLLGDSEASVRKAMLGNLAAFVEGIAGKSARDDAKLGAELAAQVTSLEASLGLDWRSQHSLLLAIPPLAQVCCLHSLVTRLLLAAAALVRGSATTNFTVARLLQCCSHLWQSKWHIREAVEQHLHAISSLTLMFSPWGKGQQCTS
jgi:hypothetical protein